MIKRLMIPLALVACGLIGGFVLSGRPRPADEIAAPPSPVDTPARALPQTMVALPDFSAVATRVVDGVTNISATQMIRARTPLVDPFFRGFFGDPDDFFGWRERPSLGSGVIVSPDGYILTNTHVIGEMRADVRVTLADQRERTADVVGVDPATDIALLKIPATGLPAVPWGDSSTLRIAEWVLAIGNPFQLNQTVTLGIVSAVGRNNVGVATYEDFIQTDAAINPGNSGGALINAQGQLVGINTAIYSQTGGYQGVGFAVPSNLARRVMDDLIQYGQVRRGSIGYVEVRAVTPQLATELGVRETRGAIVWRMRRDSEAYRAGIRPGDVILAFSDQEIEDSAHFDRLLADAEPGDTVRLDIIRDGQPTEINVRVSQERR